MLDTNIWISGLILPESKAGKIVTAWKSSQLEVVTSTYILEEIKQVLLYSKIKKRVQWNEIQVEQFILLLKFFTNFIDEDLNKVTAEVERDIDDVPILQTFLISKSDYLITGDQDLLVLKNQYNILTLNELYSLIL